MCDHHTTGASKGVAEGEDENYQGSSSPSDRDSEKGLLTGSLRQESRAGRWSLKTSAWTIWITCFNVVVLCGSVLFLMSPLSSQACLQHLSTQDKWKATSAYGELGFDPWQTSLSERKKSRTDTYQRPFSNGSTSPESTGSPTVPYMTVNRHRSSGSHRAMRPTTSGFGSARGCFPS